MEQTLSIRRTFRARMAVEDHHGVCKNPHGYRFYVTFEIAGDVEMNKPWIADLSTLQTLLDHEIIRPLNDTNLSQRLSYPSMEGILIYLVEQTTTKISHLRTVTLEAPPLYSIRWQAKKS